jgi:hypothetical protein
MAVIPSAGVAKGPSAVCARHPSAPRPHPSSRGGGHQEGGGKAGFCRASVGRHSSCSHCQRESRDDHVNPVRIVADSAKSVRAISRISWAARRLWRSVRSGPRCDGHFETIGWFGPVRVVDELRNLTGGVIRWDAHAGREIDEVARVGRVGSCGWMMVATGETTHASTFLGGVRDRREGATLR